MKLVLSTIVLACCAAPVFGQQESDAPTAAKAPAKPAAAPADPKLVKEAEELMAKVAKAYHDAKTISDVIKMDIQTPMGPQNQEMTIAIGTGTDAFLGFTGMSFTSVGGQLYVVRDDVKDKFLAVKLEEGGLSKTLATVFGGAAMTPPQFALHNSDKLEDHLESLTMGMLESPKITGHQMTKSADGADLHEVSLTGENGTGSVLIVPATNLLQTVKLDIQPQGAPEGIRITATLAMSPKVADTLATPIAFDAGKRTSVKTMDELEPTSVKEGEAAPDFTLVTLGGESVTLSKLQGSVVVLDFWATWCGPCKMALPKVNEFAAWVAETKQPIKVYSVDVWERAKTPEEIKTKVGEFWKSKAYVFDTLLDLDNAVVGKYGFSSIPTTVIVGPDGKIFKIHSGFEEGMIDALKKDCADAMKTTG